MRDVYLLRQDVVPGREKFPRIGISEQISEWGKTFPRWRCITLRYQSRKLSVV